MDSDLILLNEYELSYKVHYKHATYFLLKTKYEANDFDESVMFKDFSGYVACLDYIDNDCVIFNLPAYIIYNGIKYYVTGSHHHDNGNDAYPLTSFSKLRYFVTDKNSLCYYSENGVLFYMIDNDIYLGCYPPQKQNKYYKIPKEITKISPYAFFPVDGEYKNPYLQKVEYKNKIIFKNIKNNKWKIKKK